MKIQSMKNYSTPKQQSFGHKPVETAKNETPKTYSKQVSISKMLPVMMAMSGLITLNSCSEDYCKYKELSILKNEFYKPNGMNIKEKMLSFDDINTFNINENKDSLSYENADFKFSEIKIKNEEGFTIFGNIEKKADGQKLSFISVYDKAGKKTADTIIDKEKNEKYYVNYDENGSISSIKNKLGEPLNDEKNAKTLALIALITVMIGSGFACADKNKRMKMDNNGPDFIPEPPKD